MDPTTVIIVTNSISTGLAFLESTLALMPILILLLIFAIVLGIIAVFEGMTRDKASQPQQVQQQNNNQQVDKDHVLVDIRSLQFIKDSIAFSTVFIIIIAFLALVAFPLATNTILDGIVLLIIILLSIVIFSALTDAYSKLKEKIPKRIKKIVKKTIIYEDGSTEEKEKYEYD